MSGRKRKVGVGTLHPPYRGPLLTPHAAFTSILPIHSGMIPGLPRAADILALDHRTAILCSLMQYSSNLVGSHSQRHRLKLTISNPVTQENRHVSVLTSLVNLTH